MPTASKLPITPLGADLTAFDLARLIFADGVQVENATFTGDDASAGTFSNGASLSPGVTPGDTGIILSTGLASDFTNATGQANQRVNTSTDTAGQDFVPEFDALAGAPTFDAAQLDVDFTPDSDILTMDFTFSSEEYQEFENSIYQDFVAVWVNGSRVTMDVGDGDIDPGNVNTTNNFNMFVNNQDDDFNTEMDGLTLTLSLTMRVNPGEVNTMRIAIADVADSSFDSSLMIAADAVQADVIAQSDVFTFFPNGEEDVDVLANDISSSGSTLTITHINGVAVNAEDIVELPTGQQVQLNADGTLKIIGDGDVEDFNFTYTIFDGATSDVGLVNAINVPCFVAGTRIATPLGDRPVEDLRPGDLVYTLDEGAQPLRWIGTRTVKASGRLAPVRVAEGTFGAHAELLVSPQHRILIRDTFADLFFGAEEVLVAAKDLLDGRRVSAVPGGEVAYVHLLFDRHQIVTSAGLETESYRPGPQTKTSFDRALVEEILTLFPGIDPDTGLGYTPAVRRCLKRHEADVLRNARAA